MKNIGTSVAFAMLVILVPSVSQAKGCIKGALIGGVAGHYAGHHGVLGAAAGCIIGRHQAHAARQQKPSQPSPSAGH
jgi:hypothetical protein